MICIIGCGRSGTHLLADIFTTEQTIVEKENPLWFEHALAMARNETKKEIYLPFLIDTYRQKDAEAREKGNVFVDKTHVNTWWAEALYDALPDVHFVWIEREIHPVVASMKNHPGMRNDLRYARSFSVPNRYMGIKDAQWYDLPIASCFAYKWKSYECRKWELINKGLIDYVVEYEKLVTDPKDIISELEETVWMQLRQPNMIPQNIDKWKFHLTEQEKVNISTVNKTVRWL